MFYNALVRFRDEQLENYHGQPLEYSASDYHHISRPAAAIRAVAKHSKNGRIQSHARRRSQFSILNEVSRHSSSAKEPKSSASYDPFRASRSPVANPNVPYASVTIHRHDTETSVPEELTAKTDNTKETPSKFVPSEKAAFVPSSSVEIIQWNRTRKRDRSFQSKSSLATSRRGFSPAPAVRAATGYKRNVSFRHVRNRSQGGSSVKVKVEDAVSQNSIVRILANDPSSKLLNFTLTSTRYSSPALPSPPAVVRSSDMVAVFDKGLDASKTRDVNHFWKEEARKVSHELSQICEEAFNRSSVSTGRTAGSSLGGASDSTATSISIHDEVEQTKLSTKRPDHDLSAIIADLPASYTVRELAETRRKLIEHSAKAGIKDLPDYLIEVITHLDRLIEQDVARQKWKSDSTDTDFSKRAISDPIPRPLVETHYLPSISEEMFSPLEASSGYDLTRMDHNLTPEPSPVPSPKHKGKVTIRMVPPDSSLPSINEIKPLTIRKRNTPTPLMTGPRRSSADSIMPRLPDTPLEQRHSSSFLAGSLRYNSRYPMALEPIKEHPPSPRRSDVKTSAGDKKWSWFGKHKSQIYEHTPPPTPKEALAPAANVGSDAALTSETSESPQPAREEPKIATRKTSGDKSRSSFLKIFGKKKAERVENDTSKGMPPNCRFH